MENRERNRRKRGRPAKEKAKLSTSINLKLTESDFNKIREKAEKLGMKATQYVREMVLKGSVKSRFTLEELDLMRKLKLISVNHDYKRNIKVCKKLKDKYGLTYGKGKEKVKREKLKNPDKVKYHIYDTIKAVLPQCKDEKELRSLLLKSEIKTEFKLKRTTGEVEGLSFRYGDFSFKGSQVDRKFSYGNLKKVFQKNQSEEKKQASQIEKNRVIRGVEITVAQETILRKADGFILKT